MDQNTVGTSTSTSPTNNTAATDNTAERTPRYRTAFNTMLSEIRALPKEKYITVNLDIPSCIQTTEGVLPKIAGLRALLAEQLPRFPMQHFDQLEDRALALGHAHTLYERSKQPPPELVGLAEEGRAVHDVALSELTTQVKRGLIPNSALSTLNGGNGYENLAADLFKIADAIKSHWSKIATRATMTLSELDHMENLADDLRRTLGIREQMPELQASTSIDRQAAYTLFIEAYDEVRSALSYLRRKEGDVIPPPRRQRRPQPPIQRYRRPTSHHRPRATTGRLCISHCLESAPVRSFTRPLCYYFPCLGSPVGRWRFVSGGSRERATSQISAFWDKLIK